MRCPSYITDGASRKQRCQKDAGHEGQCSYHRKGSQGGSWSRWWGANPRPVEWIEDLSYAAMREEIFRLRWLCDDNGINWRADAPVKSQ